MDFKSITNEAPSSEALIHIYRHSVVLNHVASMLLELRDRCQVAVALSTIGQEGDNKVYIASVFKDGYRVTKRGRTFRISSTSLARALSAKLQGYGTYKVNTMSYDRDQHGRKYYAISHRYDKRGSEHTLADGTVGPVNDG